MAQGDLIFGCGVNPSVEEMLSSVTVKTNTGQVGFRTRTVAATAANIDPYVSCNAPGPKDFAELLRNIIREDACGEAAITLVTCTP